MTGTWTLLCGVRTSKPSLEANCDAGAEPYGLTPYRYLNSGPGSIAGCFVHENWHSAVSSGEKPYQTKVRRPAFLL